LKICLELRYSCVLLIGNERRAAVVGILPDNCHPSSYYYYKCGDYSVAVEKTLAVP